jgi:hypothetical protein
MLGQPSRGAGSSQQGLDGKEERAVMDECNVEIDELHDDVVVLIVPALRLLVFGRTLDEAMARARSSIDFRLLERGRRPDPSLTFPHEPSDAGQVASRTAA